MNLTLYNTATRQKELFEPADPNNVGMYVCGPTVYDRAHIGNARPVIVFDVLFRLLRRIYGADHVKYVRNITDVDDKIIDAAREKGEDIEALTRRTTELFHKDMAALNALPPTIEPRATEHIPQMIAMIGRLIDKGNAYVADGHVLFDVPSMPDYGKLSGRSREEQLAGARVEIATYKKDPADFVLWKPSTPEQPGWESPWGRGRPGWHIECSAMSEVHLGETFDIHGGGRDLIFPHHENEVAQSECAHGGKKFARYWVHNGFLTVDGEKMSKSLGNFLTVRDVIGNDANSEMWLGESLRLMFLSTHYRKPLDYTEDSIGDATSSLSKWYRTTDTVETGGEDFSEEFLSALNDDLNTPRAVAELHQLNFLASAKSGLAALEVKRQLLSGARFLGLLQHEANEWFQGVQDYILEPKNLNQSVSIQSSALENTEINQMIAARKEARKERNFAEADRIRDVLAGEGIVLEDGPEGTTWRRQG